MKYIKWNMVTGLADKISIMVTLIITRQTLTVGSLHIRTRLVFVVEASITPQIVVVTKINSAIPARSVDIFQSYARTNLTRIKVGTLSHMSKMILMVMKTPHLDCMVFTVYDCIWY